MFGEYRLEILESRFFTTSIALGDLSIPTHFLPSFSHAIKVVPDPQKKSKTKRIYLKLQEVPNSFSTKSRRLLCKMMRLLVRMRCIFLGFSLDGTSK